MIGITFGTFDLFHIGHVNLLKRAKEQCEFLAVGVSSDALNISKKGTEPVFCQAERMAIVASCRYVDKVFLEESLELKPAYIIEQKADILFMGDDWQGKFDYCREYCKVFYLPRTPLISSSQLRRQLGLTNKRSRNIPRRAV